MGQSSIGSRSGGGLLPAITRAIPITLLLLGLYYYWFSTADRYRLFLYYHDMGPMVTDTAPFSPVTSSRYVMTGLVASGLVMLLYGLTNFILGRTKSDYKVPRWWDVWSLCVIPLAAGIPIITMTQNQPVLPWELALLTSMTAIAGLGLALSPGRLAADDPEELLLLTVDGLGLMWFFVILAGIEEIPGWISRGSAITFIMLAVGTAAGLFLLTAASVIRWFRGRTGHWPNLFLAGLCVSYLLMPLVHHLLGTDGYFYITDSDNFFSGNVVLQLLVLLVMVSISFGLTKVRGRFIRPGHTIVGDPN